MWLYDFLIEPIAITLILNHIFPNISLIARIFTQDSVISSSRYLLENLSFPIKHSQITTSTKYTIFISLAALNLFGDILTWFQYPQIFLYYFCLLSTSPMILDKVLEWQPWISENIIIFQKKIINYSGCFLLSKSINYICQKNLDCNPRISTFELNQSFDKKNIDNIWLFLKIILITTIIKYLEKSKYIYSKLLNLLYQSGNIISIPEQHQSIIIDERDPKKVLSRIIIRRKWYYFYDPVVLNMILKLYREQDGNIIQEIIFDFRNRIIQFGSFWTLSDIIPIPFLAFLSKVRDPYPYNLIIPAIDLIWIILFPQHIMWISLFSAYGDYLNNNLTKQIYLKVLQELPKTLQNLIHYNKYNLYLILSIPVTYYLANINKYTLLVLPFITRFNFIYIWTVFFGWFSNYDIYHLSVLASILYLLINLLIIFNINISDFSNDDISDKKQLNIIKSYCPEKTSDPLETDWTHIE